MKVLVDMDKPLTDRLQVLLSYLYLRRKEQPGCCSSPDSVAVFLYIALCSASHKTLSDWTLPAIRCLSVQLILSIKATRTMTFSSHAQNDDSEGSVPHKRMESLNIASLAELLRAYVGIAINSINQFVHRAKD